MMRINTDFSGYGAGIINHLVRPPQPFTEVSMQENLQNVTILPASRRCCSVRGRASIPDENVQAVRESQSGSITGPGIPTACRMIHSGQLRIFYSPATPHVTSPSLITANLTSTIDAARVWHSHERRYHHRTGSRSLHGSHTGTGRAPHHRAAAGYCNDRKKIRDRCRPLYHPPDHRDPACRSCPAQATGPATRKERDTGRLGE